MVSSTIPAHWFLAWNGRQRRLSSLGKSSSLSTGLLGSGFVVPALVGKRCRPVSQVLLPGSASHMVTVSLSPAFTRLIVSKDGEPTLSGTT